MGTREFKVLSHRQNANREEAYVERGALIGERIHCF